METQNAKKDLLMNSYRRPRRQKVLEAIHPQDEKKLLAQISFKEQQKREAVIRADMKKLLEDTNKMKH